MSSGVTCTRWSILDFSTGDAGVFLVDFISLSAKLLLASLSSLLQSSSPLPPSSVSLPELLQQCFVLYSTFRRNFFSSEDKPTLPSARLFMLSVRLSAKIASFRPPFLRHSPFVFSAVRSSVRPHSFDCRSARFVRWIIRPSVRPPSSVRPCVRPAPSVRQLIQRAVGTPTAGSDLSVG